MYEPVCSESHCPQNVVARLSIVGVGVARARPARTAGARAKDFMVDWVGMVDLFIYFEDSNTTSITELRLRQSGNLMDKDLF